MSRPIPNAHDRVRIPEWAVIFPNNPHRKAVPFGRADTAEKFARSTVHGIAVPVYPGGWKTSINASTPFYHRDGGGKAVEFITPASQRGRRN